jgi:hypothetical protein
MNQFGAARVRTNAHKSTRMEYDACHLPFRRRTTTDEYCQFTLSRNSPTPKNVCGLIPVVGSEARGAARQPFAAAKKILRTPLQMWRPDALPQRTI